MTRYIQRHSLLTRVTHGVAAITCILLAVTGLFVFWPELGGSIMGGGVHLLDAHASPRVRYPVHSCSALCGV